MGWFLSTRLGRALAALGGLVVALIAAFAMGKREARRDRRAEDLARNLETRRRMDDADVSRGDPDDDLDWLHRRSKP